MLDWEVKGVFQKKAAENPCGIIAKKIQILTLKAFFPFAHKYIFMDTDVKYILSVYTKPIG